MKLTADIHPAHINAEINMIKKLRVLFLMFWNLNANMHITRPTNIMQSMLFSEEYSLIRLKKAYMLPIIEARFIRILETGRLEISAVSVKKI